VHFIGFVTLFEQEVARCTCLARLRRHPRCRCGSRRRGANRTWCVGSAAVWWPPSSVLRVLQLFWSLQDAFRFWCSFFRVDQSLGWRGARTSRGEEGALGACAETEEGTQTYAWYVGSAARWFNAIFLELSLRALQLFLSFTRRRILIWCLFFE